MSKIPVPTSKLPNTPSQSHPQKRRILSEVDENQLPDCFTMTTTNLPAPRYTTDSIKKLGKASTTYKSNKTSIPTPTFDHIQKLVGVSQSLNNAKRLSGHGVYDDDTLQRRMQNVEDNFSKDIENRISIITDLHKKLTEITEQCDLLENEILDCKRFQKKCHHTLSDLTIELESKVKKSEQTEDLILKNVGHKERLINIQIQEQKNSLNREFDNMQQEFSKELNTAKVYKDEKSIKELEELILTEETMKKSLDEIKSERTEQANAESKTLENERKKFQSKQEDAIQELNHSYHINKQRLDEVTTTLTQLNDELKQKLKNNSNINQNIIDLVDSKNNFDTITTNLNLKISNLQGESDAMTRKIKEWQTKQKTVNSMNDETREKLHKERKLRRIIENAIMDYSGKLRVFVMLNKEGQLNIPYEISTEADETCQLSISDNIFKFNKVFDIDYPHDEVYQDYSPVVENTITGSNSSVIYSGNTTVSSSFVLESILLNLLNMKKKSQKFKTKGWEFKYSLKSIIFEEDKVYDVLGSREIENFHPGKKLNINCMDYGLKEINDPKALEAILSPEDSSPMLILAVDAENKRNGKSFKSNAVYLNLTQLDTTIQLKLLESAINQLSSFNIAHELSPMEMMVKFCYQSTKSLNLFNLAIDKDSSVDFLKAGEIINCINSCYKKK